MIANSLALDTTPTVSSSLASGGTLAHSAATVLQARRSLRYGLTTHRSMKNGRIETKSTQFRKSAQKTF